MPNLTPVNDDDLHEMGMVYERQGSTFTINPEMRSEISFALTCYLDDLASEITKEEKKKGGVHIIARRRHAKLQKWLLTEFNPEALTGKLILMNGDII